MHHIAPDLYIWPDNTYIVIFLHTSQKACKPTFSNNGVIIKEKNKFTFSSFPALVAALGKAKIS